MKKIKYYYNTNTLRYEKLETPLRVKLLRVFAFLATALVTSAIISYFAFQFVGSPNERLMYLENQRLNDQFEEVDKELKVLRQQMAELENRDNSVYRAIFEANPIPDSARVAALEKQKEIATVERMSSNQLVSSIFASLNTLGNRVAAQKKSYEEIVHLMKNKEALLAATPAIQPVSNKDLGRIASGFGYRIDPIYKTIKLHAGLDFTGPTGTPIYATADGTVTPRRRREPQLRSQLAAGQDDDRRLVRRAALRWLRLGVHEARGLGTPARGQGRDPGDAARGDDRGAPRRRGEEHDADARCPARARRSDAL